MWSGGLLDGGLWGGAGGRPRGGGLVRAGVTGPGAVARGVSVRRSPVRGAGVRVAWGPRAGGSGPGAGGRTGGAGGSSGGEGSASAGAGDGAGGRPLVVTEDEDLLDDLLRLCAAAGTQAEVSHAPGRQDWGAAPLVLVGDDSAGRLAAGRARRDGVVLVGRDQDDPGVWERAVAVGAEQVVVLPDGETALVDRIADAAEGVGAQARTVGVVGGRGGAGASTLACALAVTAARAGRRTVLVDADPLGGGLDVLLGGEEAEGLRWPAFASSRGRIGGAALEESLPRLHGLRLLSWDRGGGEAGAAPVAPEAMRSVLAAARRRGGVVVVDLPRRVDEPVAEALAQVDVGLLVVPAELRAVAAAHRVADAVRMVLGDLRVVVRGPTRGGLMAEDVAELLRLPLAGELPADPGLSQAAETGAPPPGSRPRTPLSRFCTDFWARALPGASTEGAAV
ncbi:septum site-determining protein Ssd [Streptomyces sp. CMB-StM0423]|uniref:septum site-determining protein Ssd n=1 Tax=Streptomyces sp. CMB-StM0423 TaxID=2059884 RepID=UPI000C7002B8|nr:septum site-determining protein Ssd [Streptomyces sp. CMB-StM0423]AUH45015.1 septum formation initiator [Streptomyces sp. CMB-StM0423]